MGRILHVTGFRCVRLTTTAEIRRGARDRQLKNEAHIILEQLSYQNNERKSQDAMIIKNKEEGEEEKKTGGCGRQRNAGRISYTAGKLGFEIEV
jgi:hypothetical protein